MCELSEVTKCPESCLLVINDTLNAFTGKWKLSIIGVLLYGKKRFKELENEIDLITPRMLSKELKDLEANGVVRRTVYSTTPTRVEYELTESGELLRGVVDTMLEWGLQHRRNLLGESQLTQVMSK